MKSLPRYQSFILTVVISAVLVVFAGGCKNTAKGFGKDVENAGEKIQKKAD